MPLQINGATSGSATIQSTDTYTNTLTLPSGTGTLLSTANPQSGGVIQTVGSINQYSGSVATTTSTSMVSTGISAIITPKFSTSKILISWCGIVQLYGASVNNGGAVTVYRNATNLSTGTSPSGFLCSQNPASGANNISQGANILVYDSPATTSATTYTLYFCCNGGGFAVAASPAVLSSGAYSFVLQEIAA